MRSAIISGTVTKEWSSGVKLIVPARFTFTTGKVTRTIIDVIREDEKPLGELNMHFEAKWKVNREEFRIIAPVCLVCHEYIMENGKCRNPKCPTEYRPFVTKEVRRLPRVWERMTGVTVINADGWREDCQSWNKPLTKKEFVKRCYRSTCGGIDLLDKLVKEMGVE